MNNVSISSLQVSNLVSTDTKTEEKAVVGAFAALMGQANAQTDNPSLTFQQDKDDSVLNLKTEYEKVSCDVGTKVQMTSEQADSLAASDKIRDKVSDSASQIKDKIKDLYDVTDEQIEAAMETLGMTDVDLLNVNQLSQLVAQMTNDGDTITLLISPQFQELIQDVNTICENLVTELDMGLQEIVAQFESADTFDEQMKDVVQSMLDTGAAELETTQQASVGQTEQKSAQSPLATENEQNGQELENVPVQAATTEDTNDSSKDLHQDLSQDSKKSDVSSDDIVSAKQELENAVEEIAETKVSTDTGILQKSHDVVMDNNPIANQNITQQTTVQQTAQGVETVVTQTTLTATDVQNIISQITRETIVQISDTSSVMEMHLNPENLGKLTLQVVSKGTEISAQITAQNEAVKNALENQVNILRENLDAQGLKVQSIEVTVESHAFEKNLEQNQSNSGEQAEQQGQEQSERGRRNLVRDQLDDLQGLMTEEEILIAKIMTENGNTMDITA